MRSNIGDAKRCPLKFSPKISTDFNLKISSSSSMYTIKNYQQIILRILNVSRAKPACPRPNANRNGFGTFGRTSEDCLYLNIFTKNLKQSQVQIFMYQIAWWACSWIWLMINPTPIRSWLNRVFGWLTSFVFSFRGRVCSDRAPGLTW